jgi:hypothetical protein
MAAIAAEANSVVIVFIIEVPPLDYETVPAIIGLARTVFRAKPGCSSLSAACFVK